MGIALLRQLPIGPVLEDKYAIVTGANTGIGFQTALLLARRGCKVVLACRSRSKGMAAVEQINAELASSDATLQKGEASFMELDLNSLQSVRSFVQNYTRSQSPLHILINNAGLNTQGMDTKTDDGLEAHFQVNYLSHFLLTTLLLPLLRKSGHTSDLSRVVNLSSVLHWSGKPDFQELTHKLRSDSYGSSKLAMNIFGQELERREQQLAAATGTPAKVAFIVVNPGSAQSDIYRGLDNSNVSAAYRLFALCVVRALFLRTEHGAHGSVFAACAPLKRIQCHGQPAAYLTPYWVPARAPQFLRYVFDVGGPFYRGIGSCPSSESSRDPAKAKELWELSEKLTLPVTQ